MDTDGCIKNIQTEKNITPFATGNQQKTISKTDSYKKLPLSGTGLAIQTVDCKIENRN